MDLTHKEEWCSGWRTACYTVYRAGSHETHSWWNKAACDGWNAADRAYKRGDNPQEKDAEKVYKFIYT